MLRTKTQEKTTGEQRFLKTYFPGHSKNQLVTTF